MKMQLMNETFTYDVLTLSILTASGVPFREIFNFHLEGKGCLDTYERRDYEALAG